MLVTDRLPHSVDVVFDEETRKKITILFDGRPCLFKGWELTLRMGYTDEGRFYTERYDFGKTWTLDGVELSHDFTFVAHLGKLRLKR